MQLNSKESEGTNSDCIETVDENGMEVFENKVAEKLSERDVCFSEPEAIQNSTGSSGVSVLSEMTNDMDEYNPSILPDTTLNTIDKEGVDSYSMDEFTDKSHGVCKPPHTRRKKNSKTSSKSQDHSFVSCQKVELERSGTNEPRHHNQSKKRKHNSTNTNLEAVEEVDDCTLVGFLQKRLKRTTTTNDKKVDCSSSSPLEVDTDDNDPTLASFLNKLKRKKHQPSSGGELN